MAVSKKIRGSSSLEAIVSVAIISAMMIIIFPFFGQVLSSSHRMEVIRGLHLLNEIKNSGNYASLQAAQQEFPGDGITVRQTILPDDEMPELLHVVTEFINSEKKVIYSFTEFKYTP